MVIVKTPDCVVDNITNLLKNSVPDVEVDQNIGAELSYILPDAKSHLFAAVFEELESRRDELGIARYFLLANIIDGTKRQYYSFIVMEQVLQRWRKCL